jgi:hypothetical protein
LDVAVSCSPGGIVGDIVSRSRKHVVFMNILDGTRYSPAFAEVLSASQAPQELRGY